MASLTRTMSIVFLDDEDAILSSLKSLLRRQGYTMSFFVRGSDALEFLGKNPADVIVSDLRMPGMTGIEYLNRVGSLVPDAIRVILSGYEDKTVVMNALSKGLAHHYVLKPWDDVSLKELFGMILTRLEGVRRQRLETVLGSVHSLPSPPSLHVQLQAALSKENNSIDTIVREIEKNPPIVAKMLRVANSVYYASRKSITSARDAVIFIGTDYVTGLITAMEAFHTMGDGKGQEMEEVIEILWKAAVRRATIAKWVAVNTPGFGSPHLAYTASLLQDIGFAVRCSTDPEKYAKFMVLSGDGTTSRYEADAQIFGITHDDVGSALLNYWNLPQEITAAVTNHHRKVGDDTLAKVLQLAELLDDDGSRKADPHDPYVIARVPAWRDKLKEAVELNQATTSS